MIFHCFRKFGVAVFRFTMTRKSLEMT